MDFVSIPYVLIETLADLEQTSGILAAEEELAADLEADSLFHYRERVCLLQIATGQANYVIDALKVPDLAPLRPIFADPGIRKVLHGADYDIRSLHEHFGIEVRNLFDTQLAARFLGLAETSLEALLRSRFQISLNKKYQKHDWSKRPLPAEMVEYAAFDVAHLIPLARLLKTELEEKGRLAWVKEECAALTRVRRNSNGHPPLFMRVKGAERLDRRSLGVLEALLHFRETQAERADVPPFKIARNEQLVQIAVRKPATLGELEEGKYLSTKQAARLGRGILAGIRKALAAPQEELPFYPRRERPKIPAAVQKRIEVLKAWREERARDLAVEPGILLTNSTIMALAAQPPSNPGETGDLAALKGWQRAGFGEELLRVLRSIPFEVRQDA